jgi:cell division protease FtsH
MASIYGMSEVAGLMVISRQHNTFLGSSSSNDCSDKMAEDLDTHIKDMLAERYKIVLGTLNKYKDCIESIVVSLNKNETIDGEQLREIIYAYEEEHKIESKKKKKVKVTEDSSDEK